MPSPPPPDSDDDSLYAPADGKSRRRIKRRRSSLQESAQQLLQKPPKRVTTPLTVGLPQQQHQKPPARATDAASAAVAAIDSAPALTINERVLRHGTIFDAVDGRLTVSGFLHHDSFPTTRDTSNRSQIPLPPAEALFKRAAAPPRYEEPGLDPYGTHRWLNSRTETLADARVANAYPSAEALRQLRLQNRDKALADAPRGDGVAQSSGLGLGGEGVTNLNRRRLRAHSAQPTAAELPDSDLVKAIHAYASSFYARTSRDRGASDWQSLDETALLAMGVLVEETAREIVECGGWRALVEGRDQERLVRLGQDKTRSVMSEELPRGWLARKQSEKVKREVKSERQSGAESSGRAGSLSSGNELSGDDDFTSSSEESEAGNNVKDESFSDANFASEDVGDDDGEDGDDDDNDDDNDDGD